MRRVGYRTCTRFVIVAFCPVSPRLFNFPLALDPLGDAAVKESIKLIKELLSPTMLKYYFVLFSHYLLTHNKDILEHFLFHQ